MDYKLQIGQKVKNNNRELGELIAVDQYIKIDYGTRIATLRLDAFIKGFLIFEDANLQKQIELEIEAIKLEEARLAEERRLADQQEAEEIKKMKEGEIALKTKGKKIVKIDEKFGPDYHVEHLRRKPILTYQEVEAGYGVKISGFGRGINVKDDSIILISSIAQKGGSFVYHDHWTEDGDYIYSGEGKSGNQAFTKGNKAIADTKVDNKKIFLFIKFSPQDYYYQGEFKLVDYTFEDEMDEDGHIRKEYKFRLRKAAE